MRVSVLIFCIISLFISNVIVGQNPPAFPGAEGFGAAATGGRGGKVIYVTNLNANGPGSLNDALSQQGPRYILFKVSGLIDAAAELVEGNVTIAGQTSPGGIITRGFLVDEVYDPAGTGNNIILRHLRSRPHDPELVPAANYILDDGLRLDGASNIIVDHCSFANAVDEAVQISQSSDVTLQNCILAETIGDHFDRGGLLINYSTPEHPQDRISLHHNTWNRIAARLPEIICESPYCAAAPLKLELSNNLIWDPQSYIWYGPNIDPSAEDNKFFLDLNWVNNYMYARPDFPYGMMEIRLLQYAQNKVFATGNKLNLYPAYSDYQLCYCCNDFNVDGSNPNTDFGIAQKLTSRHNFPPVTYVQTETLPDYMVNNCGAFPRDQMDSRLMSHVGQLSIDSAPVNGTDYYYDGHISNPNPPAPPVDSDNDGMPDYWEISHGLNPNVQDHNGTQLSLSITGIEGYTNLECYLNCLSDALVSGNSIAACGITLATKAQSQTAGLKVFPNPSSGAITVEHPYVHEAELEIVNAVGQRLLRTQYSGQSVSFDTELPEGSYTILLRNHGTLVGIQKFVVIH